MSKIRANIIANFFGKGFLILIGLIVVPLYIHLLGIELFGVISFYTLLQSAAINLLDLGLGQTVNRELARYSAVHNSGQEARDFFRTMEMVYLIIGIIIGFAIWIGSPFLSTQWLNTVDMSTENLIQSIRYIGIVLMIQWPITLYENGLRGLQHQVLLNGISIPMNFFRHAGTVLFLYLASPTIQNFFIWQGAIAVIHWIVVSTYLWKNMPGGEEKPKIRLEMTKRIWRFATGVSATSIIAFFISQTDKIVLSIFANLQVLGLYNIAKMVREAIQMVGSPIHLALGPRFAMLFDQKDYQQLSNLYHTGSQLLSILSFPITTVIGIFSYEVLLIWQNDVHIASSIAIVVTILVFGSLLNIIAALAFTLQISSGWTRLGFIMNLIVFTLITPLNVFLVINFELIGAALSWVIINIILFLAIPIMHRKLLTGELLSWLLGDISLPFIATLATALLFRFFYVFPDSNISKFLALLVIYFICVSICLLFTPKIRIILMYQFRKKIFSKKT